jgi:general secretion pathway protein J
MKGFTLLEVLISVAIISIILTVIYGAYTSNLETVQSIRRDSEVTQAGRVTLDIMTRDLESLFFTTMDKKEGEPKIKLGLIGRNESLGGKPAGRMDLTTTNRLTPEKIGMQVDLCEVGYFLKETQGQNDLTLWRRDSNVVDEKLDEGGQAFELVRGVSALEIVYQDQDGQETDSWDTTVDDKDKQHLPLLIRIKLTLLDAQGKNHVFMTAVHPWLAQRSQE